MKNHALFFTLLLALSSQYLALARGGGDAFAGALGGSLVGGVLGNAMANSRSNQVDQTEQLRIEQERHRVNQLEREMDRRDMERRLNETQSKHGGNTLFMALIALVIVLLFGVMALGILILRKKP